MSGYLNKLQLLSISVIKKMNRLKEVLDEQGRRQMWLCQQIGRTMTSVNAWCQNKAQPSVAILFKIAEVLGVEARELLVH